MSHYPKPDSYSKNKIKIAFHLSNYGRKSQLISTSIDVNPLNFADKADLLNLKFEVDKSDIDQLENVSSKQSNAVDNVVVKKTVYDEFVKKVNFAHPIDTSKLAAKIDCVTKIKDIE